MDFCNFFIPYIFEVEESIARNFTKQPCLPLFGWPRKSRSTSGFAGARRYWLLSLVDFRIFFIPYIFEVGESISRSCTKLTYLGDLENPGQLPVSQVLEGTDNWGLWIFVISSFSTFSRSRNPLLAVSQSNHVCHCLGDLENPGQHPVSQVLEGTDDWDLWIFVISSFPTFSRSRNPFLEVSQSYHVRVTSKIQVNFRFRKCSKVLMIESCGFS